MYRAKIFCIGIVVTLALTSVVIADTQTFQHTKEAPEITGYMNPPEVEWEKTYGDTGTDWIIFVSEVPGGYIASGNKGHPDSNVANPCVWKLDYDGNVEWEVITTEVEYPGWGYGAPLWVEETSDGGYVVIVPFDAFEESLVYGILWKISADGTTEWISKEFQGTDDELGLYVCSPFVVHEISDGFIVGGYANFWEGEEGIYVVKGLIMKLDKNGEEIWMKVIKPEESSGGDLLYSLCPTNDGGYILSGGTNAATPGQEDVWLVKTDASGNVEWQKTYDGGGPDWSYSSNVYQTGDGGYIIYAVTRSYGAGDMDVWMIKTDANGDFEWTETYGFKGSNEGTGQGLDMTSDGGYIFVNTKGHSSFGAPRGDIWVNKIDDVGNVQWSMIFGTEWEDRAYYVEQTSDGGYIIAGAHGSSNSVTGRDGWLIKLAPDSPAERPEMTVQKPRAGYVFLFDLIGFPFPFTQNALVIGDITCNVDASDASGISKVEFFIDGIVEETITEEPYTWTVSGEPGTYDLKIRAYNAYGGTCKEEMTIQKIF